MKAITKILAGGIGLAAVAGAAPAAAQYYPNPYPAPTYPAPTYPAPGYGYGYGSGGGLEAIIDSILGGNRYAQGADQRALVQQCIAAVNDRIVRQYAGYRGGYGAPYGAPYGNAYGYQVPAARVLGITEIDRRSRDIRVRGTATAGNYAATPYGTPYGRSPYGYGNGYGYNNGYAAQPMGELQFECNVDYRGRIRDIDIERNRNAYQYYRR